MEHTLSDGLGYQAAVGNGDRVLVWTMPPTQKEPAVLLYDFSTRGIIHRWPAPLYAAGAMAADPEGRRVAFAGRSVDLNQKGERGVVAYDAIGGKLERTLPLADGLAYPTALAFAPGGKLLACTQMRLAPGPVRLPQPQPLPGCLTVWNAATGDIVWTAEKLNETTTALGFSPDGALVTTGGGEDRIRTWHVADGKPAREFVLPNTGARGTVQAIAFTADGTRVAAVTGDSLTVWDFASAQPVFTIKQGGRWLTFSVDGHRLSVGGAVGAGGRVAVYDAGP